MPKIRPIQREVTHADVQAAFGLAVHEAYIGVAPSAHPGLLTTTPAIAGTPIKGQLGGGYFAPPKKSAKFK